MKIQKTTLIILLCVASLFISCGVEMMNGVTGNRNVTRENRKISATFTDIKVSNGIELHLNTGSKNKVTVEADENLLGLIKTKIEDGVLKVYSEKNMYRAKSKKVYVTIIQLNNVEASSGSSVLSKDTFNTKSAKIKASSGADISIALNSETIETKTSSGADIKISGKAINHNATASSGSSINAYNLKSTHVVANANSGGDIDIYASESLEANANSGGNIDFKGSPKHITKNSNSGGSISAK